MRVQPLGSVLPELLKSFGLTEGIAGWRAVEAWPDAVGARIASRTRAVQFRRGTLVVEVDGSAWLHQLGFLQRDLLKQLNRRLVEAGLAPRDVVREIQFVMARGGIQR